MDRQDGPSRLKFNLQFTEDEEKPEIISLSSVDDALRFEDRYEALQTLGQGAHAVVKLAKKKESGELFAVKIVRSGDQEIQNNVKRTFNNTRCLRHPNIAQDIELFINEKMETSYLVMEYCPFQSLDSIIRQRKLTEEETRVVIRQLLLAIQHSHQKGICHRDLKPDNILVNLDKNYNSSTINVKVVDFGVSRRFVIKGQKIIDMATKTGNVFYCAPEIYHAASYHKQVDLWAIGVIMFQCLTQKLPLHCNEMQDFIELLGRPEKWDYQEQLKYLELAPQNLITNLLTYDPQDRITIEDALRHPFFELNSLRDVMALIGSQNFDNINQHNCNRCKSLQSSLMLTNNWDKLIKTIHQSENSCPDVVVDDLIREIGNIHIVQKHGDRCNGLIQLMNSIGSSQILQLKLNSRQEMMQSSIGLGIGSSSDSIKKVSFTSDPFSDLGKLQQSTEIQKQPNLIQQSSWQSQLGGKLENSINVNIVDGEIQTQQINRLTNFFDGLGIKEVDELIEDQ